MSIEWPKLLDNISRMAAQIISDKMRRANSCVGLLRMAGDSKSNGL
jgi:hypothetical protein